MNERDVIERGLAVGMTQGQIATVLGRDPGTISREVRRGGGPRTSRCGVKVVGRRRHYRAVRAQRIARKSGKRPKPAKLVGCFATVVSGLLEADWSPQQIAAMLPILYPDDKAMRVSHETIYQSLFVQGRGELKRELAAHLWTARTARKPQGRTERRGKIVGMTPISERPAEADDRAVPGHWEGDLILGGVGKGAVITLVERTSRFVLLAPLPARHGSVETRELLTQMIVRLPAELKRSLAWDQDCTQAEMQDVRSNVMSLGTG